MEVTCFDKMGRASRPESKNCLYRFFDEHNTIRYCIIKEFNSADAEEIQRLILSYPEITFYFVGEGWCPKLFSLEQMISNEDLDAIEKECKDLKLKELNKRKDIIENSTFQKYKFYKELNADNDNNAIDITLRRLDLHRICNMIDSNFHCIYEEDQLDSAAPQRLLEFCNLFDASNLRYAIKKFNFLKKSIHENYSNFYQTRAENIAYIVDEESEQCQLLSYCMYANGYRAFPIVSKRLLLRTAENRKKKDNHLTIRDFDLQFRDEHLEYSQPENIRRNENYSETDFIRGFKYNSWKQWENLLQKRFCDSMGCYLNCSYNNPYWHESEYGNVYCASQGYYNLEFKHDNSWKISEDRQKLYVPGIKKPLVGIYESLNSKIKNTQDVRKILRTFSKIHPREIKRTRIGHIHSVELDLYDQALSIYYRSQKYYGQGEFILSAVLSQEVIEILNGYHTSLGLQALLVHAKAENAIAMNVLGCNENYLVKDCQIRIKLIHDDVNRMVSETTFDATNILNQIFSDCRLYCKEKEHFKSEEVFIDAMAKLNDGINISLKEDTIRLVNESYNKSVMLYKKVFKNILVKGICKSYRKHEKA